MDDGDGEDLIGLVGGKRGESAGAMYAYQVWLWYVPLVVTMMIDESADWDSNEPWIRENIFEVALHGPRSVESVQKVTQQVRQMKSRCKRIPQRSHS